MRITWLVAVLLLALGVVLFWPSRHPEPPSGRSTKVAKGNGSRGPIERPVPEEGRAAIRLHALDSVKGAALSGVEVALAPSGGPYTAKGETDLEGIWRSPPLTGGLYSLTVGKRGYFGAQEFLTLAESRIVEKEFRLEPAAAIGGWVASESGQAIQGATIRLQPTVSEALALAGEASAGYSAPWEVISGEDGSYRFDGLRGVGGYRVIAEKGGSVPDRKTRIALHPGEVTTVDFTLQMGATVTGVVLLSTGEPVIGAHARLYRRVGDDDDVIKELGMKIHRTSASGEQRLGGGWFPEAGVRTGEDGRFQFAGLRPDEKSLQVSYHSPGRAAQAALQLTLEKGEERDVGVIILLQGEASFTGTVRGPDGVPVQGAKVRISAHISGPSAVEVVTDRDGQFAAWGFGPAEYSFGVKPPEPFAKVLFGESINVEIFPFKRDFDLQVRRETAKLSCQIVLPDPLSRYIDSKAMLTVLLLQDGDLIKSYRNLEFFEFDHIPIKRIKPGTYHVEVSCVGGPRGDLYGRSQLVSVEGSDTYPIGIEVKLPAGTVTGLVRDGESGKPIEGARIVRTFAPPNLIGEIPGIAAAQETRSGPDGRFTLRGLPTDSMSDIFIKLPGRRRYEIRRVLPPADLGSIDL